MNSYLQLALLALIPVFFSILLYHIDKKYWNNKNYEKKQIFYGILFGAIAITGTEFGVSIDGAIINVRDASALCAGLIFGPKAGIIAGSIGGIERYFAVYWGAGSFTQIACSVSTIAAGFYAALLRKYVFDQHIPKTAYALISGIVIEVFHMTMVFITNLNDVNRAFSVVLACTTPMIIINAMAVTLAVFGVQMLKRKFKKKKEKHNVSISLLFQKRILIVILIAFVLSNGFNLLLQSKLAEADTEQLLSMNIEDAISDIKTTADMDLLNKSKDIATAINEMTDSDPKNDTDVSFLNTLVEKYKVTEISVIDKSGTIIASTNSDYLGYDMASGEQSAEFLCLLRGTAYYVQELRPLSYDAERSMKYAGVVLNRGGFLQVGIDAENFEESQETLVEQLALNRHVGESGFLYVATEDERIVSDFSHSVMTNLDDYGFEDVEDLEAGKVYTAYIDGERSFYMFGEAESYIIIATIPRSEALFSQNVSLYLSTFMEILSFTVLFVLIFFLVKNTVIVNVDKVNASLSKITEGELDTTVNVKSNREFEMLSTGINHTVDRLKQFIQEANQRMDDELRYAAAIQHSALPSTFPPFPDRDDFDIYASMDPAKEVGGDFYDFFIAGANKIAIVIGDVSGKGVPASLFMMRAKAILKTYGEYEIAVNDNFTNTNFNLCEGNDAGLFVTAWMGVLDLETGHLCFANAGHNPPLIKKANGEYEYLRTRAGFVLGGMEGIAYKLQEMDLEPGSEIFLYTDGLTEAQNLDKELYGEDRLLNLIRNAKYKDAEALCKGIKEGVDEFVGEADQFDDMTMLSLRYLKRTFDK